MTKRSGMLLRRAAWLRSEAAGRVRSFGQVAFLKTATPALLRLSIGRWPTAQEQEAFAKGFNSGAYGLPPLLRGVAMVEAARPYLGRAAMLAADPQALERGRLTHGQMLGDPQQHWTGRKVRFLHLEKTAGSSLTTWLAAKFHPRQIDPDPHRNIPPHIQPAHDGEGARQAAHAAALVWGHYDLPALRQIDEGTEVHPFTFTILRDPNERILSLYYYWRANTVDRAPEVQFAHEHGLADFLAHPTVRVRNFIDNLYVRRLTGLYATEKSDPLRDDPERAVALACAALDSLDFVGFADDLDASLQSLAHRLGTDAPERAPRVNVLEHSIRNPVTPFRAVKYEALSADILGLLDDFTCYDRRVCEHARQRFDGPKNA
ncbi:sulfotransferase family protein [Acetobacter estunensis]|nr:sulfotransferase family 2 domain-containing protein [Acetobacter estunensis]